MKMGKAKDMLEFVDNPFVKGVVAGTITAACIAGTTAFAPVGVVGAAGWAVVYSVSGGTMAWDIADRLIWKK